MPLLFIAFLSVIPAFAEGVERYHIHSFRPQVYHRNVASTCRVSDDIEGQLIKI